MNLHEWLGADIPEEVIQQTVDWIAVLDDLEGTVTATQKKADFYHWLALDPLHQEAFAELSELWARTACLNSLKDKIVTSQVIPFQKDNAHQTAENWSPQPLLADPMMCSSTFSPSWLYGVTLLTIGIGFITPFLM